VNGVAAEIAFVGWVAVHCPQKGRRDPRGDRPNVLALDRVEECSNHLNEGGVRHVRIFEEDLHFKPGDLPRLCVTGRHCEKDCRGMKITPPDGVSSRSSALPLRPQIVNR
jgi:hypothetical protein